MVLELPREARAVLSTIAAAGGRGVVVGGALRDLMLGKAPVDWDFAATLTPAALLAAFPGAKLIGGACGTVQVPFGKGHCEVTPCRTERGYTDKRHPDEVRFVPDILADLARRDFTVNAMAFDGQVLLDPFGGQEDLKRRILRCVGDARARFEEDPLRILRLFRLASQLGFTAEWETFCAANDAMGSVASLPRERVASEVRRILMGDGPQVLAGIIAKGGLAAYGFTFAPSLAVLCEVPRNLLCRTWALIALCGADAAEAGRALGLSNRFMGALAECTQLYRGGPAQNMVQLKMKLRHTKLDYALLAATFAAASPPFAAEAALYAQLCASGEPYRLAQLAVNGDMLRYEGIRGEQCGRILNELLAAVIKTPALNKTPVLLGLARGLKQIL